MFPRIPLLIALLLAGCTAAPADTMPEVGDVVVPAKVKPVHIDESFDLALGGTKSWSFVVAENATAADIRFSLRPTADAPASVGLPVCFHYQTPKDSGSHGQCIGGGPNVSIAPNIVILERVYYDLHNVVPGYYSFTVDGEPGPMVLHVFAEIQQGE